MIINVIYKCEHCGEEIHVTLGEVEKKIELDPEATIFRICNDCKARHY